MLFPEEARDKICDRQNCPNRNANRTHRIYIRKQREDYVCENSDAPRVIIIFRNPTIADNRNVRYALDITYKINKKASSRLLTIYNKHLLRYFSEGEVVYLDNFIRGRVPEISMDELSNDYWRYSDKPADYCNMISMLLIGKIQNLKCVIFSDIKLYFPHPKVLQRHYSRFYAPEKPHHMKFVNGRDRLLQVLN